MEGLTGRGGNIIKHLNCEIFRHCDLKWLRVFVTPHIPARAGPGGDRAPRRDERFSNYAKSQVGPKLRQQKLRRQHDTETSESKQRQHQRLKSDSLVAYLEQLNSSPLWLLSVQVILILGLQGEQKEDIVIAK